LANVGEDVARDVSVTLFLSPPFKYTYYLDGNQHSSVSVSRAAGDILASSSFTIAFTLAVESNTKEGIYLFRLQLSYRSARELRQISVSTMIGVSLWRSDLHLEKVSTVPTKTFPRSRFKAESQQSTQTRALPTIFSFA
jgi:hypothetical protein